MPRVQFVEQLCGGDCVRALCRAPAVRPLPAGKTPVPLREIEQVRYRRVLTGIPELDRVLGGGVVPGSAVLVGGDPGIGKSTLLLQMCSTLQLEGGAIL